MLVMNSKPKFELGKVVMTQGIAMKMDTNPQFNVDVTITFQKYCNVDWSDMKYDEDKAMNNEAVENGKERIFATYNTCEGQIYIITEWDRSYTTILFPDEY